MHTLLAQIDAFLQKHVHVCLGKYDQATNIMKVASSIQNHGNYAMRSTITCELSNISSLGLFWLENLTVAELGLVGKPPFG